MGHEPARQHPKAGWARPPTSSPSTGSTPRFEDAIRTGKDTGLGHFPSFDHHVNSVWLTASMTGQILLAWFKLLALDGDLARAEPKTLRRVLHAAVCLARGGRRRRLKIQAS